MVRAVLVDDEADAIAGLKILIAHCCPDVSVVGTGQTLPEAKEVISEMEPDLVFLDIQLANTTGFDLLRLLDQQSFLVVFVTAHRENALEAIKANALDFLLKPVESSDLILAVEKAKERLAEKTRLKENQSIEEYSDVSRLEVPTSSGLKFIDFDDIESIIADGNYCTIDLPKSKALFVSRQLGSFEKALPKRHFLRIHKSYIINVNHLSVFERLDGGVVQMRSGKRLEVSKKYKTAFLEAIAKRSSKL